MTMQMDRLEPAPLPQALPTSRFVHQLQGFKSLPSGPTTPLASRKQP